MKITDILTNEYNVRGVLLVGDDGNVTREKHAVMSGAEIITNIVKATALCDQLNAVIADLGELLDSRVTTEACLIKEYETWCSSHGYPDRSADELLHVVTVDAHRAWLLDFISRWDEMSDIMATCREEVSP